MTYDQLAIRGVMPSDASLLSAWWNDGRIMDHAGFPYGTGETPTQIQEKISMEEDGIRRRFIIEYRTIPIGEMNYRMIVPGTAEIGIDICNATYQDRGLGRITLSLLFRELFEKYGFDRIILDTNLKNERAQHVYESLGFKRIRTRPNAYLNQDNVWQTAIDYALKKEDFISFIP